MDSRESKDTHRPPARKFEIDMQSFMVEDADEDRHPTAREHDYTGFRALEKVEEALKEWISDPWYPQESMHKTEYTFRILKT